MAAGVTIVRAESEVGSPKAPPIIRDGDNAAANIHIIFANAGIRLPFAAQGMVTAPEIFAAS